MSKFEFWVSVAMIVWALGIVGIILWGVRSQASEGSET